jgi:hypothetical protein
LASIWNEEIRKRFWNKVDIRNPDECWIWKGFVDALGYGHFDSGRGATTAHRCSYDIAYGIRRNDSHVHHLCNNRTCVNFHHLEEVSKVENNRAKPTFDENRYPCGHPRTDLNTYRYNGYTTCITCRRDKAREYQRKNRKR